MNFELNKRGANMKILKVMVILALALFVVGCAEEEPEPVEPEPVAPDRLQGRRD